LGGLGQGKVAFVGFSLVRSEPLGVFFSQNFLLIRLLIKYQGLGI
jgi:hypothetical protein